MKFILHGLVLLTLAAVPQILRAQFTDSYASTETGQYVEELKKHLGATDADDDSFWWDAEYLARTFSRTDRLNIPLETVIHHIRLAQSARNRFYPFIPVRAYQDYLLALRIRYERTAHPNWRQVLHEKLNPLTGNNADVDQAAGTVFRWIRENVRLEDEGDTYPIGFKGDLDPLTTLRGRAGTEIDLAILGVAALRSVGIAARLVWASAIANEKGGKVWLEYRSKENWIPWAPSAPADSDHLEWLQKRFGKNFSTVVTNVRQPTNITPRYVLTLPIWFCSEPLTPEFEMNLCVLGSECLSPVTGKDLMNDLPTNLDYGFVIHPYLITFGQRKTMVGYKLLEPDARLGIQHPAWYVFSFKKKKQFLEFSETRPDNFEWTGTLFRKFKEEW